MTYTRKLVRGSSFVFLMSILAAGIAYFTRIILARSLTPAEYGLFFAIFAFFGPFIFFRDLGLNQALVKFIPELNVKKKFNKLKTMVVAAFSWQIISLVIFSFLIFFFAPFLAKYYFKDALASTILKIFIPYMIISAMVLFMQGVFQGHQRIKLFSILDPLTNIVILISVIILSIIGLHVFIPVYAYLMSWIVAFLVFMPFFIKIYSKISFYKIINFLKTSKEMFIFGLPIILTSVSSGLIGKMDTLMLTYFVTLDKVGIYNVVLPTALLFMFFTESIAAVALPMVSEIWAKKEVHKLADWLKAVYKYSFIIIVPFILTVFSLSELFIKILFGKAYVSGAVALQILLIGVIFFAIARLNCVTLIGVGKPKTVTKIVLFSAVINFLANLFLIPRFGMEGAAFSTMLSYLIILILSTISVKKCIEVEVPVMSWIKTLFASIVFVFVIFCIKDILKLNIWIESIIAVLVALLVYLVLIYLLKLIDVEEIKRYLNLAK